MNFKVKHHFSLAHFYLLLFLISIFLSFQCRSQSECIIFKKDKAGTLNLNHQQIALEKEIKIVLFNNYPDAAIVRASYKNMRSDKPITLNRIYDSHGLDRLEEFNALGIKAVTINDGWFEYYGDWSSSPSRFSGGDQQLKEWVNQLNAAGLKIAFWWVPCIGGSEKIKKYPNWFIKDKEGNPHTIHWKNSQMLCPAIPEVIQYHKDLTRKFIEEYDFDDFKLDGIYVTPQCHNPFHYHTSPNESYSAYEDVFKANYETAMKLKPDGDFVLRICPCGELCSPYYLQWGNRPVAANPPLMTISTYHRIKAYKALLGSTSCVDNDFHERYNEYFPAEFGRGGLMTTKYARLSDDEFNQFRKLYGLYDKYRLSTAEYLNLYDVGYDVPETYDIKKGDNYFYTFLKPGINGTEGVPWFEDQVE